MSHGHALDAKISQFLDYFSSIHYQGLFPFKTINKHIIPTKTHMFLYTFCILSMESVMKSRHIIILNLEHLHIYPQVNKHN